MESIMMGEVKVEAFELGAVEFDAIEGDDT